ncbi:lysophospholipase-like protein 1 [Phymastichus coffea]|uniref:lysophospholipase-like protein 1 n=1 Tax=Phymastichus coffea TaxID=108790 RepID=UPI00273C4058|nr:lysophospholipase-like protein 1 [Phymastichus coffea]XP_058790138.1 lysophospholipase-like protein 1 [Phymastichus coffea]XP_058790139.1 lysophospholipase-like protein 1 [Phymastichus coffea]XP_058790140.1 lysophospholipase-like protein 1 [Phymastichus coffea]
MLPAAAIHIPRSNVVKATTRHTATLFLFHGSGGCGEDLKQWIDILNRHELKFPHIKIVYPTAPIQPYTPNRGMPSNVWFDRKAISIRVPEVKDSVDLMCKKASDLIDKEIAEGIPVKRIAVGGFSMGGCLALHLAYRYQRSIAGCLAMSAFLNNESSVYESLKNDKFSALPELLQFHGTTDNIVPFEWGKTTFDSLQSVGIKGKFMTLEGAEHELVQKELKFVKDWLLQLLPENILEKS